MPQPARKTKAATRADADVRRLVDEYGDLVKLIAPFKADIARVAALASAIRAVHSESSAFADFRVEGDHYTAFLGPKANETRIEDMQDVYDTLGHKAFIAACSMTLSALAKAGLQPLQIEVLTTKEQTGTRTLTVSDHAE